MLDLDRAARDLIAHPVRPPTPISGLAAKVRRRRFRRRAGGGLGALVALALVVSVVQITRDNHAVQKVSTAPGYLSIAGTGITPPGWTRINYGRASIAVPPGWQVANPSGGCRGYLHTVYLGVGGEAPGCVNDLTPAGAAFVSLLPLQGKLAPGTNLIVNDHQAIREADSSTNGVVSEVVEFPDLGLQYQSFGAAGQQIASTIGWSAGYLALHPRQTVPIPSTWRAINYDGVRLSVPSSWALTNINRSSVSPGACDGVEFARPEVFEGAGFEPSCALKVGVVASQGADGVWIRPDFAGVSQPPGSSLLRRSGPEISLVGQAQPYGEGVLLLIVTPAGGHPVDVDIGIGSDLTVAQAILESISQA